MNHRLAQEVCNIVKQELKGRGLSYGDLANALELSEVSVKRLLNNAQPMSIQRLINICQLIEYPLSKLLEKAERNVHAIPLFTAKQDSAFYELPALFTFWSELAEHKSVDDIAHSYDLDPASVHIYLRKLEKAGLISLELNNQCTLLVPGHTAFEQGAKYSEFFTARVLSGLQQRVIDIPIDDDQAFLISLKAELTQQEFQEINKKLEEWMFNLLRESQELRSREGFKVKPYTFGFMGAQGAFHDALPKIERLTDL
ncbi:helix-turn-helix domain-containing protein [Vibrio ouci]|uniref:XRE family transcriptional regulator n=1 Tax=Vibrio ouci TaxID=2499078 RepID=A0A4Y8WHP2_9VIBR|nr:helix-turn-helix transcriptional regulator [Vibrio ouci]TFH92183.1 XRE family transcriptional regulator [Vibrio ouci]